MLDVQNIKMTGIQDLLLPKLDGGLGKEAKNLESGFFMDLVNTIKAGEKAGVGAVRSDLSDPLTLLMHTSSAETALNSIVALKDKFINAVHEVTNMAV